MIQISARKNEEFYLVFPMVLKSGGSAGAFATGLSPVDGAYYKDGSGSWTSLDITATAAEVGSTGVYEITLTAEEMNHDQVLIKFTESGVYDVMINLDLIPVDVRLADAVEHGGLSGVSTATLSLLNVRIENTDAAGIDIGGSEGVKIFGGNLPALVINSDASDAIQITASGGKGININSGNEAINMEASSSDSLRIYSGSASSIKLEADLYGIYIDVQDSGINIEAPNDGINIDSSSGYGINIDSQLDSLHLVSGSGGSAIYAESDGSHVINLFANSDEINGINIVTPGHGINIEAGGSDQGKHGISVATVDNGGYGILGTPLQEWLTKLSVSADTMLIGTIDDTAHSPTATEFQADDVVEATASHFVNRIIIFTSGELVKQVAKITAYELVGGRGQFTVSVMTEAPANDDTFIVV
jgi:hypothetical protein